MNQVLDTHAFDACVEAQCVPFYAAPVGRPSLLPGTSCRLLWSGYFEGIDSERGIAWRTADSLALRGFLGLGLDEATPEHSTISRTRRLIDLETHRAVFTWVLQGLATADLVKGKTIGIEATTLEANAARRSIVRRDSGETYQEFLTRLAQASGIETPTRADLARLDRQRPRQGRHTEWRHPHDPDARITKMQDGRTHLAHKAEHAVDLETGAIGGATVPGADQGDTTTLVETVTPAAEALEAVATVTADQTAVLNEVVADKGYQSNQVLVDLAALDLRTSIAEPGRGRRRGRRRPRPATRCMRIVGVSAAHVRGDIDYADPGIEAYEAQHRSRRVGGPRGAVACACRAREAPNWSPASAEARGHLGRAAKLGWRDVLGARALRALADLERHAVAFPERVERRANARRLMEEVLDAVGCGDEAKPTVGQPLDSASGRRHVVHPLREGPGRPSTCRVMPAAVAHPSHITVRGAMSGSPARDL